MVKQGNILIYFKVKQCIKNKRLDCDALSKSIILNFACYLLHGVNASILEVITDFLLLVKFIVQSADYLDYNCLKSRASTCEILPYLT